MPGKLRLYAGWRSWLRAFAVLCGLNTLFMILLLLSSNLVTQETIAQRVRHAFTVGDLVQLDYIAYDSSRGWHQYNDCNILQMITNPDASSVGRALGPLTFSTGFSDSPCHTLRELIVDGRNPATLASSRYTRYWHGYIPVASALLMFVEISSARAILLIAVYASVLLLVFVSLRDQRLLLLTAPLATAGALFWALPYFGQSLSHSLSDLTVMVGIACLCLWARDFCQPPRLILFCAGFGALVVYFEMLTGSLPTATGLLFPTVYIVSRLNNPSITPVRYHFGLAALAVIAFTLGAVFTVATRIAAALLVQPSGLDVFLRNFQLYTQPVSIEHPTPGILQPLERLVRKGAVLTYGSGPGRTILYMSAAVAWLTAGCLALKGRSSVGRPDLVAFALGAGAIAMWTVILPSHTFIHAGFMTRILIVPISLGWAALLWQIRLRRT